MTDRETADRERIASALEAYSEGVEENLRDDLFPQNHEDLEDGEVPSEVDSFPIVEDYRADAVRIRLGEAPLHDLTVEVLLSDFDAAALDDDPQGFIALVRATLGQWALVCVDGGCWMDPVVYGPFDTESAAAAFAFAQYGYDVRSDDNDEAAFSAQALRMEQPPH